MLRRIFVYFLTLVLFPQSSVILFANDLITSNHSGIPEIAVDTSRHAENGQNPTLDLSQNNTPIVNITSPNNDGISVNYYNDFNVAERGILVNNSIGYGQSQIAGAVYGNPNFAPYGREADIILQEVTGLNYTKLAGYTEIFGKTAEYIIANPNGILVQGGGFINTSKLTLSATDAEVINGGIKFNSGEVNLNNYQSPSSSEVYIPEKGMILIKGTNQNGYSGLDGSNIDNVALISRALHVAQKITAENNLQIITGINDIQYVKGSDYHSIIRAKNYAPLPNGSSSVNTSTPVNSSTTNGSAIDSGVNAGDSPQDGGVGLPSPSSLTTLDTDGNQVTTDKSYSQDSSGIITFTQVETTVFKDNVTPNKTIETVQIFTPINPDSTNSSTQIETIVNQINSDGSKTLISDATEVKNDDITNIGSDDTFGSTNGMTKGGSGSNSTSTGNAKDIPTVAIDTYSLGGIYANKIYIIATENGVASRFGAEVVASDSMQINSNGDVVYNNLVATNDVNISSAMAVKNMNVDENKRASTYKSLTDISYTDSMGENISKQVETYNNSQIYANNVNINASNITNNGLIYSKNNANLSANLINNEYGAIVSENDINLGKSSNGSWTKNNQIVNYIGLIQATNDINIYTQKLDNTRDVTVNKKQWTGIADVHPGDTYYQSRNPLVKHLFYDEINDPRRSYILGGNITINATEFNNIGSTISAEKDLTITADKVHNQSISMEDTYKNYYMSWEFLYKKCSWHSFITGCKKVYGWRQRAYETYDYRQEAAQLISGRDMIINASQQLNNGNIQNYADYNSIIGQNNYHLEKTKIDTNSVSNVLALSGANLFSQSQNPSSSYLIETNPLFINVDTFKGSKYLFDRLGINFFTEETRNKRLIGDAYWENAFIKNQILEMTGKRFLSQDIASDKAQLEKLYSNALTEATSLNLKIGTELTKEQVANLKSDIVWYSLKEITLLNGSKETVLVPKLYLSKVTEENLDYITGKTSSVISANNSLTISGSPTNNELSLNNYGQIISKEDLSISAKLLTNRSYTDNGNNGLITANNATIKAIGDIINISGTLNADSLLNLISTDGSLLSETDKRRTYFEKGGAEYAANAKFGFSEVRDYKDNLAQNAYISGGNIVIETGKDTILIGSSLIADNDLNINTKGDFLATTQTLESKDTRITGSRSLFTKKETIEINYDLKNVASNISGDNITINSSNSNDDKLSTVNLYGSNIVGNNVDLTAEGDVNIISAKDKHINIYEKTVERTGFAMAMDTIAGLVGPIVTGAGFFFGGPIIGAAIATPALIGGYEFADNVSTRAGSYTSISNTQSNFSSNINADNLNIKSGLDFNNNYLNQSSNNSSDINILGSNLNANSNLDMTATGKINIASSVNQNSLYEKTVVSHQDFMAMYTGIVVGAAAGVGPGAAGGAAGGALVGTAIAPGAGTVAGAAVGVTAGAIAGLASGVFNGIINAHEYEKGEITTTTKQENINISSNVTSKGDMSLISNFNNAVNKDNVNNDITIKASNVDVKNTLTINVNGEDFNIKSANNTEKSQATFEEFSADLNQISKNAALEGVVSGAISGFLAGATSPIGTGSLTLLKDGALKTQNTTVPYLTKFLQIGSGLEIPFIPYPMSTAVRIGISSEIEHFIPFEDITKEVKGSIDNTQINDREQKTIETINSNLVYGNVVKK